MNKLGKKILLIVLTISVITAVTLILTNIILFNKIFSDLQKDAEMIVSESINFIDVKKIEKVIETRSMDTSEYKEIQQSMMEFKSDKDIKYFYTMIAGDNSAYILVDSAIIDASELGEEYYLENAMIEAFNGNITYTDEPVSDEDGIFISAYAPIKDSSGNVIAIAGVDKNVEDFIEIRNSLFKSTSIVSVFLMFFSFAASLIFSKGITKSVRKLTEGLKRMSQGDLTEPIIVKSRDEIQTIAESIDNVRKSTAKTLLVLKKSSETVAGNIENLSSSSQELAASTEEVSATISEVSSGINSQSDEIVKINNIFNNLGDKIDEAAFLNENVNSKIQSMNSNAKNSNMELSLMEEAIKEINSSFKDVKSEINELSTNLLKINEITELIDNIALQTHILALNAAIEAARAGEYGKSFAVVAEEVRILAEQSKNSALNINSILEGVMAKSSKVLTTSDSMDIKLKMQVHVIEKSIYSFKEIIDNIDEIIPKVINVNSNIKEIDIEKDNIIDSIESTAAVSEEVSASSEQISASAHQLSVSSQEVALSAQNLNQLSGEMIKYISYFKIKPDSDNQSLATSEF